MQKLNASARAMPETQVQRASAELTGREGGLAFLDTLVEAEDLVLAFLVEEAHFQENLYCPQ